MFQACPRALTIAIAEVGDLGWTGGPNIAVLANKLEHVSPILPDTTINLASLGMSKPALVTSHTVYGNTKHSRKIIAKVVLLPLNVKEFCERMSEVFNVYATFIYICSARPRLLASRRLCYFMSAIIIRPQSAAMCNVHHEKLAKPRRWPRPQADPTAAPTAATTANGGTTTTGPGLKRSNPG